MNSILNAQSVSQLLWLIFALFNGICLDLHYANWTFNVNADLSPKFEFDLSNFRTIKIIYHTGPLRLKGGRAIYGTLPAKAKPELRELNLQVSSLVCSVTSNPFFFDIPGL